MILKVARWWGPLVAYGGLIFLLSSQARTPLLRMTPDYMLHFGAYLIMGLLSVRAFAKGIKRPASAKAAARGAVFSIVYAASDEWHQSVVPGRVASFADFAADAVGVLAALACLSLYWRFSTRFWTTIEKT